MTNYRKFIDRNINWAGDIWSIGNIGAEQDGKVFCHLWSTTRTLCTQKNGRKTPINSCVWVPLEILEAA